MKKIIFHFLLLCVLSTAGVAVQPDSVDAVRFRFGLIGNYNYNNYISDFHQLPGVPNCCPTFTDGSGSGFTVGGIIETPFPKNDKFLVSIRAAYTTHKGLMTADDSTKILVDGLPAEAVIEHRLETTLSELRIEPVLNIKFFGALSFLAGYSFGYLLKGSFEQEERLKFPETGNFSSGSRVRHEVDGEIKDASKFQSSIIAGLSYELPLNAKGTIILAPEIIYSLSLTPAVEIITWNIDALRAGAAVKFSPIPSKPEIEDKFKIKEYFDTIRVEKPDITAEYTKHGKTSVTIDTLQRKYIRYITENARRTDTLFYPPPPVVVPIVFEALDINASGIDASGRVLSSDLTIEEFQSTNMQPLLNYIFFDHNSAELPERYARIAAHETYDFALNKLINTPTLPTYRQTLNIIGRRMSAVPDAKITVTGCNSNTEEEKGALELSKKRAEAVSNYLTKNWGIDIQRIKIKFRNLPGVPSNSDEADGVAENRRVEIVSNRRDILKPIILDEELLRAAPEIIRFHIQVEPADSVAEWKVFVKQDGAALKVFSGKGAAPRYVDWRPNDEEYSLPERNSPLQYWIMARKVNGGEALSEIKTIPLERLTIEDKLTRDFKDKKIDRYRLILFEFDKRTVSKANKEILNFISSRIEKGSIVSVAGYSDRIGGEDYNLGLSKGRAKTVAAALKARSPKTVFSVEGYGESKLFYGNDYPEGRFYCRTVVVIVETPIEKE